jgi:hypothetical protein
MQNSPALILLPNQSDKGKSGRIRFIHSTVLDLISDSAVSIEFDSNIK